MENHLMYKHERFEHASFNSCYIMAGLELSYVKKEGDEVLVYDTRQLGGMKQNGSREKILI